MILLTAEHVLTKNLSTTKLTMDCTNWFYLCLALLGVLLAMLAMFFNYSLKISAKQVKLEKEIEQVERINGKEKSDIAQLQQEMKILKEKIQKK